MTAKYFITEEIRAEVLNYLMDRLNKEVNYFVLESASRESIFIIKTADFIEYVRVASLEYLNKIMRAHGQSATLRAVKYENCRTLSVMAFLKRGKMVQKDKRIGDWQEGEKQVSDLLRGLRSGDEKNHVADVLANIDGELTWIEVKNCEGRLY